MHFFRKLSYLLAILMILSFHGQTVFAQENNTFNLNGISLEKDIDKLKNALTKDPFNYVCEEEETNERLICSDQYGWLVDFSKSMENIFMHCSWKNSCKENLQQYVNNCEGNICENGFSVVAGSRVTKTWTYYKEKFGEGSSAFCVENDKSHEFCVAAGPSNDVAFYYFGNVKEIAESGNYEGLIVFELDGKKLTLKDQEGMQILEGYEGKESIIRYAKDCFAFGDQCGPSLQRKLNNSLVDAVNSYVAFKQKQIEIAENENRKNNEERSRELLLVSHKTDNYEFSYELYDEDLSQIALECVEGDEDKCSFLESEKLKVAQSVNDRFDKGMIKHKNRDYKSAYDDFFYAMDWGHPWGATMIGLYHFHGVVVEKNYNKAYAYFKFSAEQNFRMGQWHLANLYLKNLGVSANPEKAREWFTKSADQGYPQAQNSLGEMDLNARQFENAIKWFNLAADQNHHPAIYNLGNMFLSGEGVTQDIPKALNYFNKSAELGNVSSHIKLGDIYLNGVVVPQNSTLALDWFEKASKIGSIKAKIRLGKIYQDGDGVEKNYKIAESWFAQAAENGNTEANKLLINLKQIVKAEVRELLTVDIDSSRVVLDDPDLLAIATECVYNQTKECKLLDEKIPSATDAFAEKLKTTVPCKIKPLIGSTFGDYYYEYRNKDLKNKKDGDYNFTITMEWQLLYEGSLNDDVSVEDRKDIAGSMKKKEIVPFTKTGDTFIPKFTQHWSTIDLKDYPEVAKPLIAASMVSSEHLLRSKATCRIEQITLKN